MLALKICKGTPDPDCATEAWSNSSACKNFRGQHPQGPKYSLSKKVDLGRSKLTCTTLCLKKKRPNFETV